LKETHCPAEDLVNVKAVPVPEEILSRPEESTWKGSPEPTVKSAAGVVSPIPTFPLLRKETVGEPALFMKSSLEVGDNPAAVITFRISKLKFEEVNGPTAGSES
jgi:hypothetical protein